MVTLLDSSPWPRMAMPSWSRVGLRLPSAATTYRARTVSSVPCSRSTQRGRDAVGVLHQRGALGPVAQLRAQLLSSLAQNRLERVLVDEHPDRRAELLHTVVQVGEVAGDLTAGERLDVVDPAIGEVLLLRALPHPLLQPGGAQDLRCAQLEVPGPRMDRRAGVALHGQGPDPVDPEEHGGGEPHQAPADDQDFDLFVRGGRARVHAGDHRWPERRRQQGHAGAGPTSAATR